MYRGKSIAVTVPAYNEETQIGRVLETMPGFVDHIIVVDDCSKDATVETVNLYKENNSKIILLQHIDNQGVGGAIATGYKWARNHDIDIAVVMAGDGQMDPDDLPAILDPVVLDEVDYTKGNRLISGDAYRKIPKIRYFGNSILSMLTKFASGYWHVFDSQSGYTAINKKALHTLDWNAMYRGYGQPNDLLVMLNIYNFRVKDVEIKAVYNIGEKSGIKISRVVFSIGWLLVKLFLKRIKEKYIIRDFHPLVFFMALGFFMNVLNVFFVIRLFYLWFKLGSVPEITFLICLFTFSIGLLSLFLSMWLDMEYNKDLKGNRYCG